MRLLISSLLFFVFFSIQAEAKELVVLVPGFFNSFTPEYFSSDIVQTFQNKGFKVYIAEGLNPVGTIEENGKRLENIFYQIEAHEKTRVAFNIVAHSAGGFYSLFVANRQKFIIKNILTVSTPYNGVEFVQRWIEDSSIFRLLTELAHLDSLVEFTKPGIKKFLNSIRISPDTKIIAFAGYQKKGLDLWNAKNLSAPFLITSLYISEKSDGVVGYSSALALGNILTTENIKATQLKDPKFNIALEHWEQVLDSRSFVFFGIRNPDYIRNEQIRFYSGLSDYLHKIL